MAAPNVTISPAGAGVVVPTILYQYAGTPTTQTERHFTQGNDELLFYEVPPYTYDIEIYKLTATAAAGYVFDHFEFKTREWTEYNQSITYDVTRDSSNSNNPAISNGLPTGDQYSASIVGKFTISYLGEIIHLDPISITAVFRPIHQPTNLLVNTYDKVIPVTLVYDDRAGGTGLLVADY